MTRLSAVRCRRCGGAIRAVPGRPLPSCLFCGTDASDLLPYDPPEEIEQPGSAIGFTIDATTAQRQFRAFTRVEHLVPPGDLRNAQLELRRLLLPAWSWSGRIETHWTALVTGATQSGKAPLAGEEVVDFHQVLIPASKTLEVAEMAALGSYDESQLQDFDADSATDPFELSEMTRSSARQKALGEMERRHRLSLKKRREALRIRTSSIAGDLTGWPVLVPVWVGAYRYGDKVYRVLVNGQSGRFHGTAPISWMRVAAAVIGTLVVFVLLFTVIAMVAG